VVEQAEFAGPELSPGFEPSIWATAWGLGVTILIVVLVLVCAAVRGHFRQRRGWRSRP
jgi:hypothetical protein